MTRFTRSLGIIAAICGCLAVAAPAALAQSAFQANAYKSPPFPLKLRGSATSSQEFTFGGAKITCESATATGYVAAASSNEIKVVSRYRECTAPVRFWGGVAQAKVRFKKPLELGFRANGSVAFGAEGTGPTEIGSGSEEVAVADVKCTISWGSQVVPGKEKEGDIYTFGTYTNAEVASSNAKAFPTGKQQVLDVSAALKGIAWTREGGLCEEFEKTEAGTGSYLGSLQLEVPNGNLSFGA
jgi:hypothetical protein